MSKALVYWFVLAAVAALMAGGRVSLRLLGDTAILVAPFVAFQLAALAGVYWTGHRTLRFGAAVDEFFAGSWPWIAACAALAAFSVAVDPTVALRWHLPVGTVLFAAAIAWSIPIDYRYYRDRLGRTAVRAVGDVLMQRAVAWSATSFYLLMSTLPKVGNIGESAAFLVPWR